MKFMVAVTMVLVLCAGGHGYLMAQDVPDMPDLPEEAQEDLEEAADLMGEGGPEVGEDAPDFTLQGLDGNEVTLSSFVGETPVVLVFGSCT